MVRVASQYGQLSKSTMTTHFKKTLIRLFSMVQELRKHPGRADLCLEIQEILIRKITYVEKQIRIRRRIAKEIKWDIRSKGRLGRHKAQSLELKQGLQKTLETIDAYTSLLHLFREIGDALAFIYIDKWDIKPMAFKPASGFISGKKGCRLERKIIRGITKRLGAVAILNDLTNCLRYGDITIPKNGKFAIIEAKSRKRGHDPRHVRQISSIEKITDYLATDTTEGLFGMDGTFTRKALSGPEQSHVRLMNRVLDHASIKGECLVKAEPGLFYFATTSYHARTLDRIVKKIGKRPLAAYLNGADNQALYPFTLSIKDTYNLYKFYINELRIFVFIDAEVIIRRFAEKGLDVAVFSDDGWALKWEPPSGPDDLSGGIGSHLFSRLFFEFTSLKWFLQEFVDNWGKIVESMKATFAHDGPTVKIPEGSKD